MSTPPLATIGYEDDTQAGMIAKLKAAGVDTVVDVRAVAASRRAGFSKTLLAGSLALTFFVYVFINAGMVTGLLPVVGVPLPLVSYGGTSVVTLLAGFGILMALYSHRKLVSS